MGEEHDASWYAATFEQVKNWGRWGADDERGALNLITPERTTAAARLVRTGRAVSAALDLETRPGPGNPSPTQHHMLTAGDARGSNPLPGLEQSADFVGIACHGMTTTHIDALCHVFVEGNMYNGFPAEEVLSTGARRNTVMSAKEGICGRGVLLDAPSVRGVEWLDPDDNVSVADLEEAERRAGLELGPGDILLVSVGRAARVRAEASRAPLHSFAGLDSACIPWLRERDVAVLGSDAISDSFGSELTPGWPMPVHQIVIASMGVHLIDNLDLAALAEACESERRWSFLFSVAPLRIPGGTGSAVNPIAVF
jgi:kynurenine formamidase